MAGDSVTGTRSQLLLPSWSEDLPIDWGWYRLDEICSAIVDCPHSTPEIVDQGPYLMARTSDILSGAFRSDVARKVSESTYLERTRRMEPRYGDLLYSREGTYFGFSAEVPRGVRVCLGQRMVLLRPDARFADPTFLRYWLNSTQIRAYIHGQRDGSVAERLNLPTIRQLPVCLPQLSEQWAIGQILGMLDDKIELNREMNETLDAMAQALFKSWFVGFDPVRAKAEGRDHGLPAHIAAFFPDSFEGSVLGETPERWQVGRLDDLLILQRGFDLPKTMRTDGPYSVVAASGPSGTHGQFMVRGPGVTTGRSGVLGNVFYVQEDFWPLNTSLWVKDFKNSSPTYAYYLLRLLDLQRFNAGSAVPTLNRNHIHGLPVVIPPPNLVGLFEDYAATFLRRQCANELESSTLASLRDLLLPKLISGELRVCAAKEIGSR